ncbi:membrane-spanning 4-domains subfamily A member 4A-like isoform X1 [Eleutherodactylus coqui]|uniref:membrane-spanning 4-domains subfamily A member 4A-like isoform X1 n=1 Tax=Eleutherodactylus coqui TaxID=57060 RepID=UPI00346203D3
MSAVAPDAGGSVVISQVRPQNAEGQPHNAPANIPKPLVRFYSGEPEVLGTTQIFVGIILLSIGIVFVILEHRSDEPRIVTLSGVPIWSGILFIIFGSLSVSASRKPTVGKVTASLVMSIFSSLVSAGGVTISALDVGIGHSYRAGYQRWTYCAYYNNDPQCLGVFTPEPAGIGFVSYVLLLYMLMLCISISTSVFACRTVCRTTLEDTTVVIYQTTTVNVPDTSGDVPPDYSAAVTSD